MFFETTILGSVELDITLKLLLATLAGGMGFFSLGAIATILVLISLTFLKKLDPVVKKDRFLTPSVTALNREDLFEELLSLFKERELEVSDS